MIQFKGWETFDCIIEFLVKIRWSNKEKFYVITNSLSEIQDFFENIQPVSIANLSEDKNKIRCIEICYAGFKIIFLDINDFKFNSNQNDTIPV